MSDFLADNNLCGQTILKIVARGNAILAQIQQRVHQVPTVYRLERKQDVQKYGELIQDFQYFANSEAFEKRVESNSVLTELDAELRETYLETLTSFYLLFESVFCYVADLSRFLEEVAEGLYIHTSLESIFYDKEGKQLMTESLYLYGVMLLLIDAGLEGVVRERLLTAYYRYVGSSARETHLDQVCKLFRVTGWKGPGKGPPGYPQDYFKRVPVDETFVQMCLGVLRSDDIYLQVGSAFPLPEHRSRALATQAGMLAVLLFFSPASLHGDNPTMREVTDKFFPDNWVLNLHLGLRMNLLVAWESFKAAKAALANTIEAGRVRLLARERAEKGARLVGETEKVLKEGVLTEDNILERSGKVINLLRDANVVLRWLLLHSAPPPEGAKKARALRDIVLSELKGEELAISLPLLLNIAQLEVKVKSLFRKLLSEREERWLAGQKEGFERIRELAEVFSGTKPLSRIERNEDLTQWLEGKAALVEGLKWEEPGASGRKLVELIRAFDGILEYHGLESVVQVREWVTEITAIFHRMIRTGSINEERLVTLQILEDFGYAWGPIVEGLTPQLQALVHSDPQAVSKLRAVFLKLSTFMEVPLMRIGQARLGSLLVQVSSFYSEELLAYVQRVLQVIPQTVFSLLHEVIALQTERMKELPTRLEKEKVRDFAQLEERQRIAELTHKMSLLAEGILKMQTTLVGVIKIDPKKLLENGIRKELVRQVCGVLDAGLTASTTKGGDLIERLTRMGDKFDGIRRSFEYIGDYVNVNGLRIYYEEFARVLNFFGEQECNSFQTSRKVLPQQSIHQSKDIPIPLEFLNKGESVSFLGRLGEELLSLTDPKSSLFLPATACWYELKTHKVLLSPDHFALLERAVGVPGLTCLDNWLAFSVAEGLERLTSFLRKEGEKGNVREVLGRMEKETTPPTRVVEAPLKTWGSWWKGLGVGNGQLDVASLLGRIGQLQLLRKRIQYQLRVAASFQAKQVQSSVQVLNRLVSSLQLQLHENESSEAEPSLSFLPFETAGASEPLGLYDPYSKVYLTLDPQPHLPFLLAIHTTNQFGRLLYQRSLGTLSCRKVSEPLDGVPFTLGISTLLAQLGEAQAFQFVALLAQYINSLLVHELSPKQGEEFPELSAPYYFLILLGRLSSRSGREVERWVEQLVPSFNILGNLVPNS